MTMHNPPHPGEFIREVYLVRIPPYRDRPFRLNVTVCSG